MKFSTHWTESKPFKLGLVIFTIVFFILFNFVPMGGITGAAAAWQESKILAFILEAILIYAFIGTLWLYIKNL